MCSFVRGSSDVTDCLHFCNGTKVKNDVEYLSEEGKSETKGEEAVGYYNSTEGAKEENGVVDVIDRFLKKGAVDISLDPEFVVKAASAGNNTVDLTFSFGKDNSEVLAARKMKMSKSNVLALFLIPAMWIAGMMPWILPGIKMVVMMVTMMNNMAFSTALFSLIRGYLFDVRPDDHIIYLNYGYKNGAQGHNAHSNSNNVNYVNNPYLYPHSSSTG